MKTAREMANEIVADLMDKDLILFKDDDARNQAIDLIEKSVSDLAEDVRGWAYNDGRFDGENPGMEF